MPIAHVGSPPVLDLEAIVADHTEELPLIMPGNSQRLRHFFAAATDIEPKPASSQVTRLGRGTAARSEHALPKHLPEDRRSVKSLTRLRNRVN